MKRMSDQTNSVVCICIVYMYRACSYRQKKVTNMMVNCDVADTVLVLCAIPQSVLSVMLFNAAWNIVVLCCMFCLYNVASLLYISSYLT